MKHAVVRNVSGLTIALSIAFTAMFLYGLVVEKVDESTSVVQRIIDLEQVTASPILPTTKYEKK